ncbi:MAG: glycosyltransferase family 2 protein, partial [Burkholderiales bacterium]|nr:glycosyltransferase family 2 protein [Burkholderiales bacterium]
MRALGCMVVRDESDIIELAVRHNLALLDGIAIIDHGSTDGTSEVLAALAAEGLPVFVTPDRNPKFRQKAMINPLVRHAVMTADIDWIFVIDADEFIAAPSRADLEATLNGLPADRPSTLAWPTRIPSSFDPNVRLPERLARTRRVVNPGHRHTKMALPRQVLLRPGVEIGAGQHELEATRPDIVLAPGHPVPRRRYRSPTFRSARPTNTSANAQRAGCRSSRRNAGAPTMPSSGAMRSTPTSPASPSTTRRSRPLPSTTASRASPGATTSGASR